MKKKPNWTVLSLTASAAVQVILLTAVWILQDLTGKKAGVSHHLQFRRTAFLHSWMTEGNVLLLTGLLVTAGLLLTACVYRRRTHLRPPAKLAAVLSLIWAGLGLYAMYSPSLRALPVYPYLMLAAAVCLLLSAVPTAAGLLQKPSDF